MRVYKELLVMETIHFPDEVRKASDVPNIPLDQTVVQKELETALLLVDQLTTEFNPEKYTDDYRTALMELIEEKKLAVRLLKRTVNNSLQPHQMLRI